MDSRLHPQSGAGPGLKLEARRAGIIVDCRVTRDLFLFIGSAAVMNPWPGKGETRFSDLITLSLAEMIAH
jgi:hypothetical protein